MANHGSPVPERDQETALALRWIAGNPAAGEALLSLLLPGIYGLCQRILRHPSDAEDAAQETFARLCREVRQGTSIENVRKWTATVAMNLCFDRRRQRAREILSEPPDAAAPEPEQEPLETVDLDQLRAGIDSLPERYRLVLHYQFVLKLKPQEIAEVMGIEPGTARVLLHRALSALRKKVRP
jgi:RNA polymerase sigma-70 factor (ECF subfamily)